MRFTRRVKYRNGAGFSIRSSGKMKLVASKHVYSGKKSIRSMEKRTCPQYRRAKGWYRWIFNPLLIGQMKTRSTYRVAKEELNFNSIHSSGKNEMLYSCRLAEKSLDFQSSLRVKRKCCRVGLSNNELEVLSALRK